jgi:hypothetical protein
MNDTVIIFCASSFMCRGQLWAVNLVVPESAQTWKVVCSQHFLEADFTSPECIRLNRMAVPTVCGTSSHSHSTPQPTEHPVQKPFTTYSKLSITASKTFPSTQPAIPHGCVNENAETKTSVTEKLDTSLSEESD